MEILKLNIQAKYFDKINTNGKKNKIVENSIIGIFIKRTVLGEDLLERVNK